jgi:hypothetical protein
MAEIKNMSTDDLEHFIEQKLLEILGDPDAGLPLREGFKKELQERLQTPSKRVSHEEVLKKFG